MSKLTIARRSIAVAGALGAAVCMRSWGSGLPPALWLPALLLASSALLVCRRHVGGQLLARAVWWSNLILGTLIATTANSSERPVAALLALCTGSALLAVGRADLDESTPSGAFLPVAFRGTLICLLVMAMADAQSLLLFGALELGEARRHLAYSLGRRALPLVIAMPLLLSVVGLYRLRLWGLLLDLAASLALAIASVRNSFELPPQLCVAYVATAAAQWVVALPLLIALVRRRAPSPSSAPSLRKHGFAFTALLVGVMMTGSVVCAFVLRQRAFN